MKLVIISSIILMSAAISNADLGIMINPNEILAKTGASNLGISQIYDHPTQINNGQFYVPIVYNGNTGAETDPHVPNSDIDYVPLSQLKGLNGSSGSNGAIGTTGNVGAQGPQGVPGRDAEAPAIDPRVDVEVREYDAQHWSTSSYASFGMQSSTARYIVGQRLTLKLGRSYEETQNEALKRKLATLETMLQRLQEAQ